MEQIAPSPSSSSSDKIRNSLWRSTYQKAFADWSNALPSQKSGHLLSGPALSQAEDWLVTFPDKLSDDEKRFILQSLARVSSSSERLRTIAEQQEQSSSKGLQVVAAVVLGLSLWIFAPGLIKGSLEARLNRDIVDEPAGAVTIATGAKPNQPKVKAESPASSFAGNSVMEAIKPAIDVIRPAIDAIMPAQAVPVPPSEPPASKPSRIVRDELVARKYVTQLVQHARTSASAGDRRTAVLLALEAVHEVARVKNGAAGPESATAAVTGLFEALAVIEGSSARSAEATSGTASTSAIGHCSDGPAARATVNAVSGAPPRSARIVAVDRGCTRVAELGDDYTVVVRSAQTGQRISTLFGHEGEISSAAFSPATGTISSASQDSTVRLWDAATGRLFAVLRGHEDAVLAVAYSPDGLGVFTASADRTVRRWDVASGRQTRLFDGHNGAVTSIEISPDGQTLLTVSLDGFARLWSLTGEQAPRVLHMNGSSVIAARFSPDGRRIATLSQAAKVQIWDAAAGASIAVIEFRDGGIQNFTFSADGRRVLGNSWNGEAALWNADTGQITATLASARLRIQSLSFSADGKISGATGDGRLVSWPKFASLSDAAQHARELAGTCLTAPERVVLGIPLTVPGWCLDPNGQDVDAGLAAAWAVRAGDVEDYKTPLVVAKR